MSDPSFNILDPLATVAAAFVGAWFAFHLERSRKDEDEVAKRVASANRALYVIFNLWNIQEQWRKEIIEPVRGKLDDWFNMPPVMPAEYGITKFEASELSFLLGLRPNIYTAILLEEQRFSLARNLIEARSHLVLDEVWDTLTRAGIYRGTQVREE